MTTTCRIVVPPVRVLSYLQHISDIGPRHAHFTPKLGFRLTRYFIRSLVSIAITRLYESFVMRTHPELECTLGYTVYMRIAQSIFVDVLTRDKP